jgi:hypothetical protein
MNHLINKCEEYNNKIESLDYEIEIYENQINKINNLILNKRNNINSISLCISRENLLNNTMIHVFTYISEDKYINYYMDIDKDTSELKFYESSTYKSYSIDDMLLLYGSKENKLDENGNFNLVLEKLEEYNNIEYKDLLNVLNVLNVFEPIIMFS